MSERPNLRAVSPDERAKLPKSVTEAAKSGSRRDLLVATRDRIAVAVENGNTPPRDLAALTKRLTDIALEIEAIDSREEKEAGASAEVTDGRFDAEAI